MRILRPQLAALVLLSGVTVCAATACTEPEESRDAWLRSALIEDHRLLLERDPDAVAGKFALMRADAYDFLRGNNALFVRDIVSPSDRAEPEFVLELTVGLVGDPHPENLGTIVDADGVVTVTFDDFDAARLGPPELDLRRLCLGVRVLSAGLVDERGAPIPDDDSSLLVRACVEGYLAEVDAWADGGETSGRPGFGTAGAVLDDLIRRAIRDGAAREALDLYTESDGDTRRFRRGELEAVDVPGTVEDLVDVAQSERIFVDALLAAWRQRHPDAGAVLDVVRRRGAGVGSYPLWRWWVLVDGPTPSIDDDRIVELKEAANPMPLPGTQPLAWRAPADNGRRIASMRAMMQPDHRNDLDGWARVEDHAFVSREITRYRRGLSASRIARELAAGDFVPSDLGDLAFAAGAILAATHGRWSDPERGTGRALIGAAVARLDAAERESIVTATQAAVALHLDRLDTDRARLGRLIDRHGPTLGWRRPTTWPGEAQ